MWMSQKSHVKAIKSHKKVMGNQGKSHEKIQKSHEKVMSKSWESYEKVINKFMKKS